MTAEQITAIGVVVTAVGGLVLAFSVLIPTMRRGKETEVKVAEVHTIVNQQRTDAANYTAALKAALKLAGIEIPADQSLGQAEAPPPLGPPQPLPSDRRNQV